MVILETLKLQVGTYHVSEIDHICDSIRNANHGKKGTHTINAGDIVNINEEWLDAHGPFDLVLASPPCNDVSRANTRNRKGLLGILRFI